MDSISKEATRNLYALFSPFLSLPVDAKDTRPSEQLYKMLVVLPAARIMFPAAGKDARHMINSQRQTTMSVCPFSVCVCVWQLYKAKGKYKYLCGNSRRFVKIFVELRQETAASH